MEEMSHLDLLDKKEKRMNRIHNVQSEKKYYLGEYKERVLVALNIDQLIEDGVYPEIIDTMKDPRAEVMKMRRDVGLKYLKPYIKEAEKINFRYEIIDGLSYIGDIGLVVVSKEAVEVKEEELIVRDVDQDFLDVGLGEEFSKNQGKHICNKCYIKIEDKLPEYLENYKKINIIDKLLGNKCPICRGKK